MSRFLEFMNSLWELGIFLPSKKQGRQSQLKTAEQTIGMVISFGVGLILLVMTICAVFGS